MKVDMPFNKETKSNYLFIHLYIYYTGIGNIISSDET